MSASLPPAALCAVLVSGQQPALRRELLEALVRTAPQSIVLCTPSMGFAASAEGLRAAGALDVRMVLCCPCCEPALVWRTALHQSMRRWKPRAVLIDAGPPGGLASLQRTLKEADPALPVRSVPESERRVREWWAKLQCVGVYPEDAPE